MKSLWELAGFHTPVLPPTEPDAPLSTALILHDHMIDVLDAAHLLCDVCQQVPWTQRARYCTALICADCAMGEPEPDAEETAMTPHAIHATASWIIETVLEAEAALARGDTDTVAVCLEAIATYAHNISEATSAA